MEPAKTLGILGGGQLGRMSAQAAKKLGIRTIIYTPEKDSPAAQIADETIQAAYEDEKSLAIFSEKVDVITYEFENIPVKTVQYLRTLKPVYPEKTLLEVSQDRIREKTYLNSINIPTARWAEAKNAENVDEILKKWGANSCILKTARFGYDGKGQSRYTIGDDLAATWRNLKSDRIIVEDIVDFASEISVIVGRDRLGKTVTYGPFLNEHRNHILHKTSYPAGIAADIHAQSIAATATLAQQINLRGVLTLEMFVTRDGKILANEIAPRTHNSGHLTLDAFEVSQFEQHVRTVCGLPALAPGPHGPATMINLIGNDINDLSRYENMEDAIIHLYGKSDPRPGRKMGHVTIVGC